LVEGLNRSKKANPLSAPEVRSRVCAALAAIIFGGCQPAAVADVGNAWIVPAPNIDWMQWTSDSQTLLYADYDGDLSAVRLGSHSPRVLAERVSQPHLAKTSSGDVVFFERSVAGSLDEVDCLEAPLLGEELGTPRIVSTAPTLRDFVVSAQGETVALPVPSGVLVADVATGDSRVVALGDPVAFAPNASSLFGSNGANYVTIDASGTVSPVVGATGRAVHAVTRWEADLPSSVIVDNSALLDVPTGETRPLLVGIETNARSFAAVSGDPLRPAAAYVWQEECLRYSNVGHPPIEVCAEPQVTLHRVDLETGAARVIAAMTEIRLVAVSPDGRKLASFGNESDSGDDHHIDLKDLPPL
jgi:hypothetical protein